MNRFCYARLAPLHLFILLASGFVGTIAPSYPAIAQTSYSLESWQGDVRLTRSGRREQRLTRQTGRQLDAPDQLRLQGRRSWANVRCPQGLVRWDEVRQSRSVAEICNPSGTISRGTGTRNGESDLRAIAEGNFLPQTYFDPRTEQLTWPAVPSTQRYRLQWVDRDRELTLWQTETRATQLAYGGPPLTGRLYGLTVTAIGPNNQSLSTYSLNRIRPLPRDVASAWARDQAEIMGDRTLMPDSQRWALVDQAMSVGRVEGDPELWWTVVAELLPEAATKNPTVHLRLALAYLHLSRYPEARSMAQRALAATGRSPSAARAEAVVMLAQAAIQGRDCEAATAALSEARSIYANLGETRRVEAIDSALESLRRRSADHCPR